MYLIIYLVGLVIAAIIAGVVRQVDINAGRFIDDDEKFLVFFTILCWPIFLGFLIVAGVLIGLFKLLEFILLLPGKALARKFIK